MEGAGTHRLGVPDVNAQVETMEQWLALLSPGEAMVALQHVLCRRQPVQAQYLLTVLNAKAEENAVGLAQTIRNANDPAYVRGLSARPEDAHATATAMLTCTAVLRANNPAAASEYPPRVAACVAHAAALGYLPRQPNPVFDACHDLIVLCLQHPGFDHVQRQTFSSLLQTLEALQVARDPVGLPAAVVVTSAAKPDAEAAEGAAGADAAGASAGNAWTRGPPAIHAEEVLSDGEGRRDGRDSRSKRKPLQPRRQAPLPPPTSGEETAGPLTSGGPGDAGAASLTPRAPDEAGGEGPASPKHTRSGDEQQQARHDGARRFSDDGFEKVKNWLKALRLHKYNTIFQGMSYQQMVSLSSEDLEQHGITARGARTKMVKSIQQLRERNEKASEKLSRLDKELASGRCGEVIAELKEMVTVPFPHDGEMAQSFAAEYCRVLEKAFTSLVIKYAGVTPHPHGQDVLAYADLLDAAFHNEVFSQEQKTNMFSWKSECQRLKLARTGSDPRLWREDRLRAESLPAHMPGGQASAKGRRRTTDGRNPGSRNVGRRGDKAIRQQRGYSNPTEYGSGTSMFMARAQSSEAGLDFRESSDPFYTQRPASTGSTLFMTAPPGMGLYPSDPNFGSHGGSLGNVSESVPWSTGAAVPVVPHSLQDLGGAAYVPDRQAQPTMRAPGHERKSASGTNSLSGSREGIEQHFNPETQLHMDTLSTSVAEHALRS